ncbi:NRDE family protein [Frateuria aurantia]
MCLIAVAWQVHPQWPLILIGNRDEFHARPTAELHRWDRPAGVIGGRDLEAGGSWLAVDGQGRCAAVTNVRRPQDSAGRQSRGGLVTGFVAGAQTAEHYAQGLATESADAYRPFNLLLFDRDEAWFASNRPEPQASRLTAGLHVLSNASLDTDWPKSRQLRQGFQTWLSHDGRSLEALFPALADRGVAADAELPATGLPLAQERALSAGFIAGTDYGTRASSVVAIEAGGAGRIIERRFGPQGAPLGETRIDWQAPPAA